MKIRIISILVIAMMAYHCMAQSNRILSQDIASLQVMAGDNWQQIPVIKLSQETPLVIGFDDLSHEYRRCSYKIEHMEADWTPSEGIFNSEFLDGFSDDLLIEDYAESFNTSTLYTHYSLQIPNKDVRLKLSGNYKVSVFDDNESSEVPLIEVFFMVCDESASIAMSVTTNTDIDINSQHQQVEMKVAFNNLNVTDTEKQLKTVVMQNGRWNTARWNAAPQYRTPSSLEWRHCRDFIFPAGNEHHKFEYLDIHRNSLGIDHTAFDGTNYHAWINTDEPRKNYVYDVSGNGAFVIRNTDNYDNDTQSDYFLAHFSYFTEEPLPGKVYIDGWWTRGVFSDENEMIWNADKGIYECVIPLKMGYYSYQYVLVDGRGNITTSPLDGNYYQTGNSYQALLYYRPIGGRTDLLVGFCNIEKAH